MWIGEFAPNVAVGCPGSAWNQSRSPLADAGAAKVTAPTASVAVATRDVRGRRMALTAVSSVVVRRRTSGLGLGRNLRRTCETRVGRPQQGHNRLMERDPRPHEEDVDPDDAQALSRSTGGVPYPAAPDQGSTTGTTPSEQFVGRVAGQDVGYAEEQGGERRARYEQEQGS